jgi:hypothetical protein
MKHELSTHASPPPLLHAFTVEDDELHPVTRAHGICPGAPPPLPLRAAAVDGSADELLTVLEEELHPITIAQWIQVRN